MKIKLFSYFFVLLFTINGYSQTIVLKPDDHITPFFSMEEWIFASTNWGYDSYGLTSFEPHTSLFASSLESSPSVFINGSRYNTQWLTNDLATVPNLPFSLIDSVIIKQNDPVNHGFFTSNGSIEIYTKEVGSLLTLKKGLINEINDPGPHISSDRETVNIDAVNFNESIIVSYPEFLNSKFVYSRDRFSYTNRLIYDRELNYFRFSRTSSRRPDGSPRMRRNIDQEFTLFNQIKATGFTINTNASYIYSSERYSWYALTGIEIPAEHKKFQASINLKPVKTSPFQQSQITVSRALTDSLLGTTVPTYGINETTVSHSSSFLISGEKTDVSLYLSNNIFIWYDVVTGNNKTIHDASFITGYDRSGFGNFDIIVGNYTLGLQYQKQFAGKLDLNFSSFRRNLKANGYNFNLWNDGLGLAYLNRNNHTVSNQSGFVNTYSFGEISSGYSKKSFHLNWSLFSKYYWDFVHTNIDYSFKDSGLQLDSDITYSDLNNVGFVGYNLFARFNPLPKTFIRTSLSGRLFQYGNSKFIDNSKSKSRILFSQSIQYKADENALFEVLFRYISPRDIVEFEPLENNPLFTTAHVRSIYLLNITAKTWMFNRSLAMTLALRNLLNSTESYNTNGQYYNMSISVSASLALGKK